MSYPGDETRRDRQQLDTMRHLPPGTHLLEPGSVEERQLLADLIQLPAGQDPVAWLAANRGPLCARIALHAALEELRGRVVGVRRARWYGFDMPKAGERALLGQLVDLPEESDLFDAIPEHGLAAPDALRATLRRVRQLRGTPDPADARARGASPLLADLLALPEDVDALAWLREERASQGAAMALHRLMEQARPPLHSLQIGPVVQVTFPRAVIRMERGLRVTVDEVAFGKGGTLITVRTRIRARRLPGRGDLHHVLPRWPGFNQLVDDLGHRYLLQHYEGEAGRTLWWATQRMRAAFYPSVAPGATRLTFIASAESIEVAGFRLPGPERPEPERVLLAELPQRSLRWQVAVPARAR